MLLSDGRPADTKQALTYFQEQFIRGPLAGTQLHGIGGSVFASACFVVHQLVLLAMCFNAILQSLWYTHCWVFCWCLGSLCEPKASMEKTPKNTKTHQNLRIWEARWKLCSVATIGMSHWWNLCSLRQHRQSTLRCLFFGVFHHYHGQQMGPCRGRGANHGSSMDLRKIHLSHFLQKGPKGCLGFFWGSY